MMVPAHLELSTICGVLLNWLSVKLGFNSNVNYYGIIMEQAYPLRNLLAGPTMTWWQFGEGAGPGITREILSACIDNMLSDETFWVGTTDNQMTLCLSTLHSHEVRVRRVKVFGVLTAIYIAQIGTVLPLLSLAFLQASLKGSCSIDNSAFLHSVAPSFQSMMQLWPVGQPLVLSSTPHPAKSTNTSSLRFLIFEVLNINIQCSVSSLLSCDSVEDLNDY
ncbi:hypothetical protein WG66_014732 [Moniliophthora roreri]|nr:hypothetical protein WG66_014732 [Moniliophthora roreri]